MKPAITMPPPRRAQTTEDADWHAGETMSLNDVRFSQGNILLQSGTIPSGNVDIEIEGPLYETESAPHAYICLNYDDMLVAIVPGGRFTVPLAPSVVHGGFTVDEWDEPFRGRVVSRQAVVVDPVRELLGDRGSARLASFRNYPAGWDNGRGRQLSDVSEFQLTKFLASMPRFTEHPSIFLTRAGNLQLVWRDREGAAVELEFFDDHVEYYSEHSGEEEIASYAELSNLVQRLS